MMPETVVTKSLHLEVYKNPGPREFDYFGLARWVAEWRPKDDPSFNDFECETEGPTLAYGRSRKKAIKNAVRILNARAEAQARKLRLEREADQTFDRTRIEIDVTKLRLEESK
jgi:hypothetical protein